MQRLHVGLVCGPLPFRHLPFALQECRPGKSASASTQRRSNGDSQGCLLWCTTSSRFEIGTETSSMPRNWRVASANACTLFADTTAPTRRKRLFSAHLTGTFWIPAHLSGTTSEGVVTSEYVVPGSTT